MFLLCLTNQKPTENYTDEKEGVSLIIQIVEWSEIMLKTQENENSLMKSEKEKRMAVKIHEFNHESLNRF